MVHMEWLPVQWHPAHLRGEGEESIHYNVFEPQPPLSSLVLRANGVYKITITYGGGSWSVGLPPDHPHAYRDDPARESARQRYLPCGSGQSVNCILGPASVGCHAVYQDCIYAWGYAFFKGGTFPT